MMSRRLAAMLTMLVPSLALAQQSASYELTETTVNNGGRPINGVYASSASHRITFDALGDGVLGGGMASASFHAEGGFVSGYPPPGEVLGQAFTDSQTQIWLPDKAVGVYEAYRGTLASLQAGGTGICLGWGLTSETLMDASLPASKDGYFYLVTARNLLGEEGTMGYRSSGVERPNPMLCP